MCKVKIGDRKKKISIFRTAKNEIRILMRKLTTDKEIEYKKVVCDFMNEVKKIFSAIIYF